MFKKRQEKKLTEFETDLMIVNDPMPRWVVIESIILNPPKTYGYEMRSEILSAVADRKDTPGFVLGDLAEVAAYRKDDPLLSKVVTHNNAGKMVFDIALRYVKNEYNEYRSLMRGSSKKPVKSYSERVAGESLNVDPSAYWTMILESVYLNKNTKAEIREEAEEFYKESKFICPKPL